MLETILRPTYQRWCIDPLLKLPFLQKIHPFFLTLFSTLFGLFACPLIAYQTLPLSLIFLVLSGYLDTLDGSLARYQNRSSPKGAVLDITSDRLVEFAILFGLYLVAPTNRAILTILMLGSILLCITSFLVIGIFSQNSSSKSFHYSPGIMERAEAFLFFAAMILLPSLFTPLALLFTLLILLTSALRLTQFLTL